MQSIVPIHGSDRIAVRAFLKRLSPETRRARYLGATQFEGDSLEREVKRLENSEATMHEVLLAKDDDEVRGIGEYVVDAADTSRAEIAVVVEDGFQHRGIGTSLFLNLEQHALRGGIRAFTGHVANDNYRVLRRLRAASRPLEVQAAYASSPFELTLCDCERPAAA